VHGGVASVPGLRIGALQWGPPRSGQIHPAVEDRALDHPPARVPAVPRSSASPSREADQTTVQSLIRPASGPPSLTILAVRVGLPANLRHLTAPHNQSIVAQPGSVRSASPLPHTCHEQERTVVSRGHSRVRARRLPRPLVSQLTHRAQRPIFQAGRTTTNVLSAFCLPVIILLGGSTARGDALREFSKIASYTNFFANRRIDAE
jgi:hypothetical protein